MKTLLYRKNQLVPSDTAIKRFYCNSLHVRSFLYHKSRRNDRRKGVICTYTYYRNDPRFLKIRNVDDNVDPVAQVLVDDNITLDHVQRLLIQRIDYILYNIGIHGNRTRRFFFLIIHIWRYTNILCIIKYGKYNYFPVWCIPHIVHTSKDTRVYGLNIEQCCSIKNCFLKRYSYEYH